MHDQPKIVHTSFEIWLLLDLWTFHFPLSHSIVRGYFKCVATTTSKWADVEKPRGFLVASVCALDRLFVEWESYRKRLKANEQRTGCERLKGQSSSFSIHDSERLFIIFYFLLVNTWNFKGDIHPIEKSIRKKIHTFVWPLQCVLGWQELNNDFPMCTKRIVHSDFHNNQCCMANTKLNSCTIFISLSVSLSSSLRYTANVAIKYSWIRWLFVARE